MDTTPGFNIVFDRGAYVLDVDVKDDVRVLETDLDYVNDERQKGESDLGISFPLIRNGYWERALSQAQQDHERKQSIQQDIQRENQKMLESVKVKVPPRPYEPTKEERQSHEATHWPFHAWCEICVKAKSPDGRHTKQLVDTGHIPLIEFDYAFATDTPGDPNKRISMLVATESIHGSIFAVVAWRRGGQDDYLMQSFQNCIDRLGVVKAADEFKKHFLVKIA